MGRNGGFPKLPFHFMAHPVVLHTHAVHYSGTKYLAENLSTKTNPALNAVLFIKLVYTTQKVTPCLLRVLSNQDLRGLLKRQCGGFKPSFRAN